MNNTKIYQLVAMCETKGELIAQVEIPRDATNKITTKLFNKAGELFTKTQTEYLITHPTATFVTHILTFPNLEDYSKKQKQR